MTEDKWVQIPGLGRAVQVPANPPPPVAANPPRLCRYGFPFGRYMVDGERYWFKFDPKLMGTEVRKWVGGKWTRSHLGHTEVNDVAAKINSDAYSAAIRFGVAALACSLCGTKLSDAQSVKLGIGPDCAKKAFPDEWQDAPPTTSAPQITATPTPAPAIPAADTPPPLRPVNASYISRLVKRETGQQTTHLRTRPGVHVGGGSGGVSVTASLDSGDAADQEAMDEIEAALSRVLGPDYIIERPRARSVMVRRPYAFEIVIRPLEQACRAAWGARETSTDTTQAESDWATAWDSYVAACDRFGVCRELGCWNDTADNTRCPNHR